MQLFSNSAKFARVYLHFAHVSVFTVMLCRDSDKNEINPQTNRTIRHDSSPMFGDQTRENKLLCDNFNSSNEDGKGLKSCVLANVHDKKKLEI